VIPRGGRGGGPAAVTVMAPPPAAAAAAAAPVSIPTSSTAGNSTAAAAEWTADEQARLETALKTVPAGLSKAERWEKIAAIVGTRSRGACARRFKALRAQLRSAGGR
jgi:hypothetical protein